MHGGTALPSQCKRCKSNVVNGIKCKICDSGFHLSCAKLHNSVKFIDDNDIVCCADIDKCDKLNAAGDSDAAAFFDAMDNLCSDKKVDIHIFKYILNQKDVIIKELRDKIDLLNIQLNVISNNKSITTHEETKSNVAKSAQDKPVSDKSEKKVVNIATKGKNVSAKNKGIPNINKNEVALEILQEETKIKLNNYIRINDDISPKQCTSDNDNYTQSSSSGIPNNEWKRVEKRRNQKKKFIVGSNLSTQSVKGVPKYVSLHVYRIDKDTTAESLSDILREHFPEIMCTAISPKHPNLYASFKVKIFENNFRKAMDPSLWPFGACVSRFLEMKPKINHTMK